MKCSGDSVEMYTLSFAFKTALTLANASSSGMRSGLYGGRNISRAPTPVMISYTLTTWCMLALSMITIEWIVAVKWKEYW